MMNPGLVASYIDVWIEVFIITLTFIVRFVASCIGAWIEDDGKDSIRNSITVASCIGAWIEVNGLLHRDIFLASHLM